MWCHVMLCYVMHCSIVRYTHHVRGDEGAAVFVSWQYTSCHVMRCYVASCHVVMHGTAYSPCLGRQGSGSSIHASSRHYASCHVMWRYVMSYCVMSCCGLTCSDVRQSILTMFWETRECRPMSPKLNIMCVSSWQYALCHVMSCSIMPCSDTWCSVLTMSGETRECRSMSPMPNMRWPLWVSTGQ